MSSMLHRDFSEPLERKALFLLQQKNLPLENMPPEEARPLLSQILFQYFEEDQRFRRYLAAAFIFEFIRKNGRHYNRKNFEKSWKWIIAEKREDHPALDPVLGLNSAKEEEAILQASARYWYHFRWHAWERQGMLARAVMGRKKREKAEEMQAESKFSLAVIQTKGKCQAGKILRLRDETGNLIEIMPLDLPQKAAYFPAVSDKNKTISASLQKRLPPVVTVSREIFQKAPQKVFAEKS